MIISKIFLLFINDPKISKEFHFEKGQQGCFFLGNDGKPKEIHGLFNPNQNIAETLIL